MKDEEASKLKLAAFEYSADIIKQYTRKLLDGGQIHGLICPVLDDIIAVFKAHRNSIP
jgi:hypothetical protein